MKKLRDFTSNEKTIKTFKIVMTVLLIACYGYSLTRWSDFYAEHMIVKIVGITLVYAIAIVAVNWKNTLSDKKNLIVSMGLFCLTPFMCYAIVECANSGWSALFVEGAGMSIKLHLCNGMIYVYFMLLILMLTTSFRAASVTTYAFFTFLGGAMYYICMFRGTAFVASDMYSTAAAANVGVEYSFAPDFLTYLALSLGLCGIITSARFNGKVKLERKARLAAVLGAVLVVGAFYITYFKIDYTKDMKVKLFSPQDTYVQKGSMLTFVRSFRYLFPDKPEGYSVEKVKEIAAKYSEEEPAATTKASETPNLIMIMNESFSDVSTISNGEITTNKDAMPFVHNLTENTYKATLHEERRGGGTAIMEFEALTGDTNAFFPAGTIAYQTVIRTETPSLATQLASAGYVGISASHPHRGSGYNRINAYPLIGFKNIKFVDDFVKDGNDQKYGNYISDEAAYNELIDQYEASQKKTDDPFFTFQVTMQNHAPYEHAETRDVKITSKKYKEDDVEQYINYVHESDRAFKKLIEYFSEQDDPTVVVMFGDHAPRFADEYYKKLLGITGDLTDEQEMSFQKTPLVVWANFDIGSKDLGDMSDNYIGNLVVDTLGVKKTGYQRFLEKIEKDVPVINSLGYTGKNGKFYDIDDKTSPYYEEILEYRMLEYNELVDTKNRISGFFE